jgi:hypothetical protein
MRPFASVICVLLGHRVGKKCQSALRSSPNGKYETLCDRCRFPLILELDKTDSKSYFVTEADSLELLTQSDGEGQQTKNLETPQNN